MESINRQQKSYEMLISTSQLYYQCSKAVLISYNGKCLSFSVLKEGAGEDIPIMLLGNKTDLDGQRVVPLGVAEKLAKVSDSEPWSGTNRSPLNIWSMVVLKQTS